MYFIVAFYPDVQMCAIETRFRITTHFQMIVSFHNDFIEVFFFFFSSIFIVYFSKTRNVTKKGTMIQYSEV